MKLSVIVPVYHVEDCLDAFMQSITAQTFRDFEVILVDDCSPDRSGAMCDSYAAQYPFCRVIHHDSNQGVGAARNTALDAAQGEFVTFVDPDDAIREDCFEQMMRTQEAADYDLVISNYVREFMENGVAARSEENMSITVQGSGDTLSVLCALFNKHVIFFVACKLMRLSIIREQRLRFPSAPLSEDLLFNFDYYRHIQTIGVIDAPLYRYRRYVSGRTTATTVLRDIKGLHDLSVTILKKELLLAEELEHRGADAEKVQTLYRYIRAQHLQFSIRDIFEMAWMREPLRADWDNLRYISNDYSRRQKGHAIWRSGSKVVDIFHFCLLHRLNGPLLVLMKIQRKRNQHETRAN